MKISRSVVALILFFLPVAWLPGQTDSSHFVLTLDSLDKNYSLNSHVEVWENTGDPLSFEEILKARTTLEFSPIDSAYRASRHNHELWVRFRVKSSLPTPSEWVLLDLEGNNYVDIYYSHPDSGWIHRKSGTYLPGKERDLVNYNLIGVALPLGQGEITTVYGRIRNINHNKPEVNLMVLPKRTWDNITREGTMIFIAAFLGIVGIMFFYSLMVFIGTRELAYLYYGLYLGSIAMFLLFAGGPHQIKAAPILSNYLVFIALSGISIFYFQFGRSFLNTSELIPKWDTWIRRYILLRLALLFVQLLILGVSYNVRLVIAIEFSFFLVDALMSLALYFVLIRTGSTLAWFFIVGSAVVFVFALTYIGIAVVVLETNPDFDWFFLAVVAEIMAFSLGLGYRMRKLERDKLEAQRQQLETQEALNKELSKVNTVFGRFVPHEFLSSLGYNNILEIRLGDAVEENVTVLFSDIRDYTTLSEQMTPTENFHFLNSYLGRMGPAISHHRGFVNQYLGDGIMALFPEGPQSAVQSSLDMLNILKRYNRERIDQGRKPIKVGIGLHTGPLVMGIIGDTLRMEPNVVSDTVNSASRLEGLTKYFDITLLVSSSTVAGLTQPQKFRYRFLGRIQVKGRQEPLGVYDFYDGDPEEMILLKERTQLDFEEGLACYYKLEFPKAIQAFDKVLKKNPSDLTAQRYRDNSIRYLSEGVPEGWQGVEMVFTK